VFEIIAAPVDCPSSTLHSFRQTPCARPARASGQSWISATAAGPLGTFFQPAYGRSVGSNPHLFPLSLLGTPGLTTDNLYYSIPTLLSIDPIETKICSLWKFSHYLAREQNHHTRSVFILFTDGMRRGISRNVYRVCAGSSVPPSKDFIGPLPDPIHV